jgi:cell division protein FtsA
MRGKFAVGIDIGTYQIKVVVAEESSENYAMPNILGVGYAESKGLRHGYIINQNDAVKSIRKAINQAEKASHRKIEKVFVSVGGIGLSSVTSNGSIMISRADSEISEIDIEKVAKECQAQIPNSITMNRQIIHQIPLEYKIDGKTVLGNPVGMKGIKLEVKMLFVTSLIHHINELISTIEGAGVEIIDVMAAPLAAGLVTLSKTERIAGCVLTNIGSETASIVVYENDIPISLDVFPIGSNDITNDIALGLKVSLEDAEKIKKGRGEITKDSSIPQKKLDDIIFARLKDIFELVDVNLKKIGKSGLLPAGVIITGGGSGIINIEDLAKASLKLPSKTAKIACDTSNIKCGNANTSIKIKDATWSVSYGLCVFGLYSDEFKILNNNSKSNLLKDLISKISRFFHKFLP